MRSLWFSAILIAIATAFIPCRGAIADTDVSGHITADETWSPAGSPYVLVGDIYVDPGVTLTVTSGTIVLADNGYSHYLYVRGTLNANGAVFTSVRDPGGSL
jgi:hypothetical protein